MKARAKGGSSKKPKPSGGANPRSAAAGGRPDSAPARTATAPPAMMAPATARGADGKAGGAAEPDAGQSGSILLCFHVQETSHMSSAPPAVASRQPGHIGRGHPRHRATSHVCRAFKRFCTCSVSWIEGTCRREPAMPRVQAIKSTTILVGRHYTAQQQHASRQPRGGEAEEPQPRHPLRQQESAAQPAVSRRARTAGCGNQSSGCGRRCEPRRRGETGSGGGAKGQVMASVQRSGAVIKDLPGGRETAWPRRTRVAMLKLRLLICRDG